MITHRTSETEPKEKKERAPPAPHYVSFGTVRVIHSLSTTYPQVIHRKSEHTFVLSAPNIKCC